MKITRKLVHEIANDFSGFKRTLPPKIVTSIIENYIGDDNLTLSLLEKIVRTEVKKICSGII